MSSKKVTLVTTYYPPEKGAASNRIAMMAKGFLDNGFDVQVISPMPNYPEGRVMKAYRRKLLVKERIDGVNVWRLPLYPSNSNSGMVRMLSMFSYALPVFILLPFISFRRKNIIIQCPPLPVALFAALISRISGKHTIVNVSDLWPLSAKEMGAISEGAVYKIMDYMASGTYHLAHNIVGQSEEIIAYIQNRYVQRPSFVYRNLQSEVSTVASGKFSGRVVYAGLIGHAQKISDIVSACVFPHGLDVYGDGGDVGPLKATIASQDIASVRYHGSVSPAELASILPKFSYSLIPLTVQIHGAVPSKLFDSVSRGVPVIFMGGGEGARIVKEHELGFCVNPGDFHGLNKVLSNINEELYLTHYKNCLGYTKGHLSFDNQFDRLLSHLSLKS